jgi:hypothetical protein
MFIDWADTAGSETRSSVEARYGSCKKTRNKKFHDFKEPEGFVFFPSNMDFQLEPQ